MDWMIYRDINDFYDFYGFILENVDLFRNESIPEKIDSLRIGFKDLLISTKYDKLLKPLLEFETKKVIIFQDTTLDLILDITHLYNIHPIIENLILFFYLSKEYKECFAKEFFELSLREYMGFYLKYKPFELDCTCLNTFVLNGLIALNDSVNATINYLINIFNKHHFCQKSLEKEYSETLSVFDMIKYNDDKNILNICSGNACGIHLLNCRITCLDLNRYMGINLLNKMNICDFIKCNIYDKMFESISSLFNVWIGIHTCRDLSIRIVETFMKHAPESAILYLVPCCHFAEKQYKVLLPNYIYERISEGYKMREKKHKLRPHGYSAMHIEYLSSLCADFKLKIKTLRNMKSEKNKILIVYK